MQVKARKVCIESNWGNKVLVSEKKCLKINYEGLRPLGGFQVTRYFCCRKNFFFRGSEKCISSLLVDNLTPILQLRQLLAKLCLRLDLFVSIIAVAREATNRSTSGGGGA